MEETVKRKLLTTKTIVKIAILSALATVVMALKIPLPFLPSFYKLEFSEIVVLIGGFALGPAAAVIIEALKVLMNFFIDGTVTAGIGEAANFLMGCSLVVPASIVYMRIKTKKGAVIGCVTGFFSLIVISSLLNYFLLIPAYAKAFGLPIDAIIGMGSKLNGNITDLGTLILFATIPLNVIKGLSSILITIIIYKHISGLLKK